MTELRQRQVPELKRVGLSQPQLNLSSTDSAILAGATHAGPVQLAAWNSCPLPRPSVSGAVGEIHQSAVINALATVLAGRTIRSDSLGGYVKQITGKIPDDLKDELKGEAWSITFNTYEPVRIEFDNDLVTITVRLVRMTRGKQAQDDAVSITAKYYPQLVGNQLVLTRQGDVEVVSDKQTRGAVATTMRSFVRSKFDKTFRQSISTEPINLDQLRRRFPQANRLGLDIARIAFRL